MNADQVIEGIGKAVAANSTQEYCLFWSDYWWWMCMTKDEWSGWMQAVGTFAAILFALALPFMQNKFRRARTYVLAKHGLMQLVATYEAMEYVIRTGAFSTEGALKGIHPQLQSLVAALELVRADELSPAALPIWWSARANANQLTALANLQFPEDALTETLAKYKSVANGCLSGFHVYEPRVFWVRATKIWG